VELLGITTRFVRSITILVNASCNTPWFFFMKMDKRRLVIVLKYCAFYDDHLPLCLFCYGELPWGPRAVKTQTLVKLGKPSIGILTCHYQLSATGQTMQIEFYQCRRRHSSAWAFLDRFGIAAPGRDSILVSLETEAI
jgi:hypothetical protein